MKKDIDNRIRFLKDFMLPMKRQFFICFILMLFNLLLQLYFPLGVQRAIDNGIVKNNVKSLLIEIFILMSVGLVNAVLSYIKYYKITKLISMISFNIKFKIMKKLQKCSMKFFSNSKPGEITSIIERDVEQISDVTFTVLSNILIQGCSYIVVLGILFSMNWKIALYALIASPFLAVFQFELGKRIKKIYKKVRENIADINDFTQEWVENVVNIQLLNYDKTISEKYKNKQLNNIECVVKTSMVSGIVSIVGQILNTFGIIMILYWVGLDVLNGAATVGVITSLTIYVQRVYSPLTQIMQGVVQVQNSTVILDRIYSLIDCKDIVKDGDIGITEQLKGNIKIKDVTFNYGEKDVLKNVNLEIESGDVVGIVGRNGTGKSTISKLLTRLYDPVEGSIYIDDIELNKYKLDELREKLVYVQATPYIFPGTIKENILLDKVDNFEEEKLKKIINEVGLEEDINNMDNGINTVLYSHSTNLSTGQCQKLSLARILAKDPSIVILDEPTSALDLQIEKEISKKIKNAFKGKTLIIISHRDEVLKICNKIYKIEDFKIKENNKLLESKV